MIQTQAGRMMAVSTEFELRKDTTVVLKGAIQSCTAKSWRRTVKSFRHLSSFSEVFQSRCDCFIEGRACEKLNELVQSSHPSLKSQMFHLKRFWSCFNSDIPLCFFVGLWESWDPILWGLDCGKGFPALFPNSKTQHILYWFAHGWKHRSIFCTFPIEKLMDLDQKDFQSNVCLCLETDTKIGVQLVYTFF